MDAHDYESIFKKMDEINVTIRELKKTLTKLSESSLATERQSVPLVLTPRCPQCDTPVAYEIAPHNVSWCPNRDGIVPVWKTSVEYGVYCAYAMYPGLYGRSAWARWHIFDHMFVVIGNGMDWSPNGYLLDHDANVEWMTVESIARRRQREDDTFSYDQYVAMTQKMIDEMERARTEGIA